MATTTGVQAIKDDPIVSKLPVNIDQQQSIDLIYEIDQPEDIRQISRVNGGCIKFEYPVKQAQALDNRELIESQFASHNAVDNIDNELIDRTICKLIPAFLNREGLELPEDSIEASRVQALILKRVRDIESDENLISHLKNSRNAQQLFPFYAQSSGTSPSTFSRARNNFMMESRPVENSVKRLKHTLYRNGLFPDRIPNQAQPIPRGPNLPNHLRYQALTNWGDLLLDQLTKGISLGRASNFRHTVREIIASLAIMVYCENFDRGWYSGQLWYQEDIITPTQLGNIIKENIGTEDNFFHSKQRIESVCEEMHLNLLGFADEELELFSEPVDVAIDPTWVSMEDFDTTPGAIANATLEDDGGFCFLTGAGFSSRPRVALGVNLITDKKKLPDGFRELLQLLGEVADIGWIMADREFDNPDIIEACRTENSESWIVRLRNHHDLLDADTFLTLRNDGHAVVSFGETEINAFWKDISNSELDWVFNDEDSDLFVLSGKSLDETTISKITTRYGDRWSVENLINQLKNDFSPDISKKAGLIQLFILNISSIFYNMYRFINQSLSPGYGLPLQPKTYEVLIGLADSTFAHHSPQTADVNL